MALTVGVGEGLVVGDGDAETVGLGDAAAAVTGSQDSLPAVAATEVATAALALPAETEKTPQETPASMTPVADRATVGRVRRVRLKRI